MPTAAPEHRHNHQDCIDEALHRARELCATTGARLTPVREQVLKLIWQSHQPVGAYHLLESLDAQSERRNAPPTIYRALDFLQEQGLVHRIASLNAFIGCADPSHHHPGHFLICKHCNTAIELEAERINSAIETSAMERGFRVEEQCVEVVGCCERCHDQKARR